MRHPAGEKGAIPSPRARTKGLIQHRAQPRGPLGTKVPHAWHQQHQAPPAQGPRPAGPHGAQRGWKGAPSPTRDGVWSPQPRCILAPRGRAPTCEAAGGVALPNCFPAGAKRERAARCWHVRSAPAPLPAPDPGTRPARPELGTGSASTCGCDACPGSCPGGAGARSRRWRHGHALVHAAGCARGAVPKQTAPPPVPGTRRGHGPVDSPQHNPEVPPHGSRPPPAHTAGSHGVGGGVGSPPVPLTLQRQGGPKAGGSYGKGPPQDRCNGNGAHPGAAVPLAPAAAPQLESGPRELGGKSHGPALPGVGWGRPRGAIVPVPPPATCHRVPMRPTRGARAPQHEERPEAEGAQHRHQHPKRPQPRGVPRRPRARRGHARAPGICGPVRLLQDRSRCAASPR